MIVDNDSKLHQKQVQETWKRWGIKLIPGAGRRCHDRKKGGFPVDYPELMPLDRTIHHLWKNAKHGGLYALWNSRKPSRKMQVGSSTTSSPRGSLYLNQFMKMLSKAPERCVFRFKRMMESFVSSSIAIDILTKFLIGKNVPSQIFFTDFHTPCKVSGPPKYMSAIKVL